MVGTLTGDVGNEGAVGRVSGGTLGALGVVGALGRFGRPGTEGAVGPLAAYVATHPHRVEGHYLLSCALRRSGDPAGAERERGRAWEEYDTALPYQRRMESRTWFSLILIGNRLSGRNASLISSYGTSAEEPQKSQRCPTRPASNTEMAWQL